MKQVELTDTLRQKLTSAAGDNVDLNNLAVFHATALNTKPVRKNHPVYKGGVHTRGFLDQMLSALKAESRPLQTMHNGEALPSGRIFDGEVLDSATGSELRVLFWIDRTSPQGPAYINLVNNGTVDQVSVAILPKSAVSNKSGFDFLGPDATFENIWTGTDPDGNVMGENGAHVLMSTLDTWFEMSLVGQGGIPGARIHPSGSMTLAASGRDAPPMTLILSVDDKDMTPMDLTALVDQLTTAKADLALKTSHLTEREAALATAQARITELEAHLPAAEKLASVESEVTSLKGHLAALFTHVAALTGDATTKAPEEADALVEATKANVNKLRQTRSGFALDAATGTGESRFPHPSNAAFRRRS